MKHLLTLLFSLSTVLIFSQHPVKNIQANIDQVTVYLSGAQISISEKIHQISATKIRAKMRKEGTLK